jgi:hypothetical protein
VAAKKRNKKPETRQVAFRVSVELADRLEAVAMRLELDLSNFMRLMCREMVSHYEKRADRMNSGEVEGGDQ